jgi:thioredoxin-like negative regulator of GroEL
MQFIDQKSFISVIQKKKFTLISLWADWCDESQINADILQKFSDQNSIALYFINWDKNKDFLISKDAKGLPMLLVFNNGKCAQRISGILESKDLEALVLVGKPKGTVL